jgi:hypothetical protein
MTPFEELQAVWQSQQQPAIDAAEAVRLTRGLRDYVRRQSWIYAAKAVLVTSIIVWMLVRSHSNLPVVASTLLIATGAGWMLYIDWRSRRALTRLDFTGASLEFVRGAIAELEKQRDPFQKYYWAFLGSLAAGENLCFAFLHSPGVWTRVGWHMFGTLAPFAGYKLGHWVRTRRFESECRPLLAQLREMEQSLVERES